MAMRFVPLCLVAMLGTALAQSGLEPGVTGNEGGKLNLQPNMTIGGPAGPRSSAIWDVSSLSGTPTSATVLAVAQAGNVTPLNYMNCSDSVVAPAIAGNTNRVDCLLVYANSTGSWTGSRTILDANLNINTATTLTINNDFLLPAQTTITANVNLGGGLGTEIGAIYGFATQVNGISGATHYALISGAEFDSKCTTGCSVAEYFGLGIGQYADSASHGSTIDVGLGIWKGSGGAGWNFAIQFGIGTGTIPVPTSGTLIGTNDSGATVAKGIDLSGVTISTAAFKSPGFTVDGSGNITANSIISTLAVFAASGASQININEVAASQQAKIVVQDNGTNKWEFGKQTDDSFFLFDDANSQNPLTVSTAGLVTIGEGSGKTLNLTAGTLQINGTAGVTQTCTVNQAKTLIFTLGILTGGTCNT